MSNRGIRLPAILRQPIRADRFPPDRREEMVNAAIDARLAAAFALYDIPPSSAYRWEMLCWILLGQSFAGFRVQDHAPARRPNEWRKREKLLAEFENYPSKQRATAKAKAFLKKRSEICEKAGIKSPGGLLTAIRKAERERRQSRMLANYAAMEAAGLLSSVRKKPT
jgi:hypothetical protein